MAKFVYWGLLCNMATLQDLHLLGHQFNGHEIPTTRSRQVLRYAVQRLKSAYFKEKEM